MNIHIVNYEIGIKNGILTKYADMMVNGIIRAGHEVTVSNKPEKADINHHINYQSYQGGGGTTMVTHIDTLDKLKKAQETMKEAHGICFSKETRDYLVKNGVDKKNLSVILPATSVTRRPRIIAIMTQLYPDGRKREGMWLELLKTLNPDDFAWNIVGEGWEKLIEEAVKTGHRVLHVPHYSAEVGQSVLNSADYLLYFGKDEGAISVLDAVYAGVRVIAPNVGFHKELGIDHPFDTQEELNAIFSEIGKNRAKGYGWNEYVEQHLKLWQKLRS